jgi:hypothetical protein
MRTFIACLLFCAPLNVSASEQDIVPWQSVVIKSPAMPEAGVVTVEAVMDGDEWKALNIDAHGRKRSLEPEDLKGLKGFPLSSIRITAEGGYQPIGGHTVSLRFERSFYNNAKELKKEQALVMVPKYGPFKVLLSGP